MDTYPNTFHVRHGLGLTFPQTTIRIAIPKEALSLSAWIFLIEELYLMNSKSTGFSYDSFVIGKEDESSVQHEILSGVGATVSSASSAGTMKEVLLKYYSYEDYNLVILRFSV